MECPVCCGMMVPDPRDPYSYLRCPCCYHLHRVKHPEGEHGACSVCGKVFKRASKRRKDGVCGICKRKSGKYKKKRK